MSLAHFRQRLCWQGKMTTGLVNISRQIGQISCFSRLSMVPRLWNAIVQGTGPWLTPTVMCRSCFFFYFTSNNDLDLATKWHLVIVPCHSPSLSVTARALFLARTCLRCHDCMTIYENRRRPDIATPSASPWGKNYSVNKTDPHNFSHGLKKPKN